MKLKNKITLLTSSLVIGLLLFAGVTVYVLFIRTATQNEMELLQTKVEQLIEKIGPEDIMQKKQDALLRTFVPEDTTIRIINRQSQLVTVLHNEEENGLPTPKFVDAKESQIIQAAGQNAIIVRVPIVIDNQAVGSFEMIETLDTLDSSISILITILLFTIGAAILLSIIGGSLIARTIVNPISRSIQTMQEIENSLTYKKIPSQGHSKDELYQMTETFNRMMERLQESSLKQQQFVWDASHELNTTLTIVEGYANMLRRWGTEDPRIQKESIENIYQESRRMRIMTQQLLDLASSQQSKSPEKERFNLIDCCHQAAGLATKLQKRSIQFDIRGEDPMIIADPLKIKQLLLILLDNALKYSNQNIVLLLLLTETKVELRVKDYGIGIPQNELELIFERFYRVDPARHRSTGGTGLGLPIARSIVHDHGGTISVESREDKGTEMIVVLPRGNSS